MGVLKQILCMPYELFHIVFRHFLFPTTLGLRKIGNPGKDSPVFLSGNYTLTVFRLARILRKWKVDCYLLVANSRGSNVWCAAGMNEFNDYDVADAVRVTGLSDLVSHRKIIAPPYSAVGIDKEAVKKVTGFSITWGPTHLRDLPRYIKNGFQRTEDMIHVQWGMRDRLEQAVAAAVMLLMNVSVLQFWYPRLAAAACSMIAIAWVSQMLFWRFLPTEKHWIRSLTFIGILSLAFWGLATAYHVPTNEYLVGQLVLLAVTAQLCSDLHCIATIYKTSLGHWLKKGDYSSLFKPVIDPSICKGCRSCLEVCPRRVLAFSPDKKAVAVSPENCIECLACVKQCKYQAVFNTTGVYKDDIKSIPDVGLLLTRDARHLDAERRWVGLPTEFGRGVLNVVDKRAPKAKRKEVSSDRAVAVMETPQV